MRITARDVRRVGIDYSLNVTRSKKQKAQPELLPIPRALGATLGDYIQGIDLNPSALLFPSRENAYRYQLRECAERGH